MWSAYRLNDRGLYVEVLQQVFNIKSINVLLAFKVEL